MGERRIVGRGTKSIKALSCDKMGHVWWVSCDLLGAGARAQLCPIHPSIHCPLSVQPGPALACSCRGGVPGTSFKRTLSPSPVPVPDLLRICRGGRRVALEFLLSAAVPTQTCFPASFQIFMGLIVNVSLPQFLQVCLYILISLGLSFST